MSEKYDITISPPNKKVELNFGEVFQYKDLIILFVKRNFSTQYKQTVLGPLWFIINPLLSSFINTIIFGNIAGISSDGIPYFLFSISGYTLWNYFASCVSATSSTFTANAGIMGKVYFPRLTVPISTVIYSAINMLVVFVLSLVTALVYFIMGTPIKVSAFVVFVPILMVQTAILGLGVGIIVSSLTTKYRDLTVLVGFGITLWMYLTPVVYPISQVKGALKTLIMFNPMSTIISNYRFFLFGIGTFDVKYWVVSICITLITFLVGVSLFNKVEKTFMDTI